MYFAASSQQPALDLSVRQMQEAFGFVPVNVVGALDEIAHVREETRRMGIPCIER